jgi:hypothetical protein
MEEKKEGRWRMKGKKPQDTTSLLRSTSQAIYYFLFS